MLMRRKMILAAASVACALPAAPAMADGPTNSATANAANVSYTTQNAAQIGGYHAGDQVLIQASETNQNANAYANAQQLVFSPYPW